jgi:hypothetical protein
MACDPEAIAADAVAVAELPGGTGHERVRIDWLNKRLAAAPGSRHVDDVFGKQTVRGVTRREGWLRGPGIGDNATAVATAVAVAERALADPGEKPLAVVLTVGEEGLGGLRGARHACRERGARGRHTGRRPRLLRRRGHARPTERIRARLHRRRRRPTAGRAGRDPGLTHPIES